MKKYLDAIGVTHLYKALAQELPIAISSNKLNELFPLKNEYLTFEALEDGTFSFSKIGNPAGSVSYSLNDGVTWTALGADSSTPTVAAGSKVLWKGNYRGTNYNDCGSFSSTGKFNASGNVMSLMYGDDFKDKVDLAGSNYCFSRLFYGCSSLIDASNLVLPATTLANCCYQYMFYGCTSLKTAPELPATTLAAYCYYYMFCNCTTLTTAPELPATTLANCCYQYMFYGCTSLKTAPELPALILKGRCYSNMFQGCTSLTTPPKTLGIAMVSSWCCASMFQGCTSLTTAPELPAEILTAGNDSYDYMFKDCSKLCYIKALFTTTPDDMNCNGWVSGVSSTGTFVKNPKATWDVVGREGVPDDWVVEYAPDMSEQYITFVALGDGMFKFSIPATAPGYDPVDSINYSLDNGATWVTLNVGTYTPAVPAGSKIMWKGNYTGYGFDCYSYFSSTGKFDVEGNIMSLMYGDDFRNKLDLSGTAYCFYGLFKGCYGLINAYNLVLPATTLGLGCYAHMFSGCTSLTTAPELPATTLVTSCYYDMFYNCTNLCYIKALFTTDPSTDGYTTDWVSDVSSTGTFVKNSAATWNVTGTNGVPTGWDVILSN